MLATLAGFLALLFGLLLLLLPLLVGELSRPRDSAWGAVVLLLGLVLVTSAERLTGAPMLAVLCGGLLVGRLGSEVAQGRWRVLSDEERLSLRSAERWGRSLNQLTAAAASLLQSFLALVGTSSAWLAERRQSRSHGKRWVRSEAPAQAAEAASTSASASASDASAPSAALTGAGGPAVGEAEPAASGPPPGPSESMAGVEELVGGGGLANASDSLAAGAAVAAVLPAEDASQDAVAVAAPDPGVRIVADLNGVDALLAAASDPGVAAPTDQPPAAAGDGELSAPQL